jgi:hypothetical protein
MAGYTRSRNDIDQQAGTLAVTLRNTFAAIDRFGDFLDGMPDADLEAAPYNYTGTEVAQLKSAIADLRTLAGIYRGTDTAATAYDFQTFAKLLTGVL